ncbi:HIT-type Zinc finger family protein [Prunus dulcis]|uniref:HIT-type Zinc finger family protein n=1 Tax=Prunus dulcis TaxID=3755 RepID=A0A4Y1RWU6_PRUDU|nr:HIT-type Zinc finger family protein [Prunus dulcis]
MRWWLKPSARTISLSKEGPLGPDSALPPVSNLSSTKPSLPLAVSHSCLYYGNWKSDAIGSSHRGAMCPLKWVKWVTRGCPGSSVLLPGADLLSDF